MQAAGWYADPTGRHEFRYWRPGWSDLAADGSHEVSDPLRPRWRRLLGIGLVAQLVLVPVLGFIYVGQSNKLDSRVGVVQAADQVPPEVNIVYAPCPSERIRHIVLSASTGKGTLAEILWSAVGDAAADTPIRFGQDVDGMTTKNPLRRPVRPRAQLILLVATNQLTNPEELHFSMADVPTSGALTFHGTYSADDAFRAAALDTTPCGAEHNGTKSLLAKVLVAEGLLALVGTGLLVLPRYSGPTSRYG